MDHAMEDGFDKIRVYADLDDLIQRVSQAHVDLDQGF